MASAARKQDTIVTSKDIFPNGAGTVSGALSLIHKEVCASYVEQSDLFARSNITDRIGACKLRYLGTPA